MRFTSSAFVVCALLGATPALAQVLPTPQDPVAPLMHGALVYHGNYCGPGNKGVHPAPVDALDAACMRHDACVKDFKIPSCGCNARLAEEAAAVAADASAPAQEREAADFTARGARALPCQ
ncbi:hypothetical protein [Lichenibacterium dinghuense]|uniref:hypothetical protein n=1 Tax=Lichenibacterium dinghuense TaxID=2895977 RepID=UPI001F396757|nr:hypothetical protein [Lichenibacterium sp. 6Y81]